MSKLTLEEGKKGFQTLKYDNRYIHSKIDPIKEAHRYIAKNLDSNFFIVFGLGLGYHLKVLLEKLSNKECFIFVFSEKQEIIDTFYENGVVKDQRIHIFKNSNFEMFIKYFEENIAAHEIGNPVFIELAGEVNIFHKYFNNIKKKLDEYFRFFFQSLFTKAEFVHLWYRNILINSKKIFTPKFSMHLQGDAVLIAAGPSLKKNLPLLKKMYKKVPFFCVDTALKPLIEYGLIPDVVIATDPQVHNYKDFFHIPEEILDKIILAADISVYYKIPEIFKNIYFFRTEDLGDVLFNEMNNPERIKPPLFPGGGSVSSSTLTLLYYIGVQKIIMVGQDLYYPHLTHSVGTIHYNRAVLSSNKFFSTWNFFQSIIQKRGHRDLALENLARWIDDFILINKGEVYQIEPEYKLKNSKLGLPDDFSGKLILFSKPLMREHKKLDDFLLMFLEKLLVLRNGRNIEKFSYIRKTTLFSKAFDVLFLKQDLYLHRKNGEESLYLGGCFRLIDRIMRALHYSTEHLKR